jgi:putative phosphotransacetylase
MNSEILEVVTRVVKEVLEENRTINESKIKVPVGISGRHIHLSRKDLDILFGNGYELTKKKDLMGGQFAAEECVTIIGSKLTSIEKVRILGPIRKDNQIELSKTDSIKLGIKIPLRESGNIDGSGAITIVGPAGALFLNEGCIIAKRHIHMSPSDAIRYGIKNNDLVKVKASGERGGILEAVKVRIDSAYTLEMHIDTDESNAMDIKCGDLLEIIKY